MINSRFGLFVILSFLTLISRFNCVASADFPHLTVDVRGDLTQPAGVPILLLLTATNNGDQPYFYTGRDYPAASAFVATITDHKGNARQAQMSNDRGGAAQPPWSGPQRRIPRGKSVEVPAMIDALPEGSYTIRVKQGKSALDAVVIENGKQLSLTVKDDPELAGEWERRLLTRIRKGDQFGQYVASTYLSGKHASKSLIDALLQDLLADDDQVAYRTAQPLYAVSKLPPNATAIIQKAMTKHIAKATQRGFARTSILPSLASLASKIGTNEALESVLTLARTDELRGGAVIALGSFKQEKAALELRRFLKDENEELRFRAAQRLSERKDSQALELLLVVAHDPKSRWRGYSFESLLKYPDDSRVEPAIKSGLNDADSFVRGQAEFALRNLRPAKKP